MRNHGDRVCLLFGVLLIIFWSGGNLYPAEKSAGEPAAKRAAHKDREQSQDQQMAVTHHSMKADGEVLRYTATAGCLELTGESGKPQARMFFVAYVEDQQAPSRRPIAFIFNGGPGAASMYLQLGGLGPKRVPLAKDGTALPDRYKLVDNDATWLSFTDLVFVDPVGTGYSRAASGVDPQQFYDVEGDVRSLAEFIRLYLTRYDRWLSPKYMVGESYGGTRAASLARELQNTKAIELDGVVLLSSAMDFQTFSFGNGNDLACALALPTFTATALYHGKLAGKRDSDLESLVDRARRWATTQYLTDLAAGDTLSDSDRNEVAQKLAEYSGLSRKFILDHDLRVTTRQFTAELLAGKRRQIGLLDGRVVTPEVAGPGRSSHEDPTLYVVTAPWLAALVTYLREDLQYKTDLSYEYLSRKVNESWKWGSAVEGYVNMSDELAKAVTTNAHMKVFMAAGYYDLTTPFLSQKYTMEHLGLDPSLRDHVRFAVYRSGHQIYVSDKAMRKMKSDVAAFLGGSNAAK